MLKLHQIIIQVAIDPVMGFTRKKLSQSYIPPFPDWESLNVILKNEDIEKLFSTKWMSEVTLNMRYEERQELREQIKIYFTSNAGFNLVSCDRYSNEGRQGAKVLATKVCLKGKKISGLVGRTCPISDDQEKELALRRVDTSCIVKSARCENCKY